MTTSPVLVTGAAGFIGFHVAKRLLEGGRAVVGLDNLNAYYDPKLKEARLAELARHSGFRFVKLDLADRDGDCRVVRRAPISSCRASRRAGRRALFAGRSACLRGRQSRRLHQYSRRLPPQRLPASALRFVVVGLRQQYADAVLDRTTMSIIRSAFTARRKKANELMAHSYAHLFNLPATGLAVLHGLWTVGPARHGDVDFRRQPSLPAADQAVQPRRHAARLHLR